MGNSEELTIRVYDLKGVLVNTTAMIGPAVQVDLSHLEKGTYLLMAVNATKVLSTQRIVLAR